MAFENGPYVQAACFCDMVVEDKLGTLSLIRVVDSVTHMASGPNPPEDMPPIQHALTLVVMLKSGNARGRSEVRIVPELPTGETKEPLSFTVHFDGEERGHNLVLRLAQQFSLEGLYWYNIIVDGSKLTSMPLRVKYNRMVTGPAR
jgi:hypothetical protein